MQTLKRTLLLGATLVFFIGMRSPVETNKTQWFTLEQAAQNLKKEKRPILIDLYTDWCGWCKVMDRKTYANKNVGEYLASKFYPVKVDAESKVSIQWDGKEYQFNSRYKTNDFALYLTGGQLSYPTTVIIPTDGSAPQAIPGYLEPKEFELILKYFGEGHYGKTPFEDFQKKFKSSW